jgi:hypothetical protein
VDGVRSSSLVRSLDLEDLRILRINNSAGWNGSLVFDTLSSRDIDPAGAISIASCSRLPAESMGSTG